NFWATETALSVVMLAYNLMSVFRQAVIRQKSHKSLPRYTTKCWPWGRIGAVAKKKVKDPL
ncbi:MAG: hypothetical protein EBS66_18425, partial [Betaproteobacteria bacterium]|nr:hypothetical protein [Betaproteobacteria bacterium]